jgi:hypothetical protein
MPPTGQKLTDGFPTTILFANAPNISLWPKEVTPFGFDAGGPNDATDMLNTRWRTRYPKKLITATNTTGTCHYDPRVIADIQNQMGVNQLVTVVHPNGATWAQWGWLDKFTPQRNQEGTPPLADFTIEASNLNGSLAETSPVYTAPSSTTSTTTTTL